jgi:hypothetical protein
MSHPCWILDRAQLFAWVEMQRHVQFFRSPPSASAFYQNGQIAPPPPL